MNNSVLPNQSHLQRVLVLGGTGFIGRHAVAALQNVGASVVIGSRHPHRHEKSGGHTPFQQTRLETLLHPDHWLPVLENIHVVVNCVGILRQRPGESYDRIHHLAPAALSLACAKRRVRLIHVSALGLHEGAKSRFLSSKLAGEKAIAASNADYSIVRPSLLDGEGGFGARWLRGLARLPVQLIPRGAKGKIAPLTCSDLGQALSVLAAKATLTPYREVELGGTQAYEYGAYLRALRPASQAYAAWQIAWPNWMTRVGAHVCDVLHFSPFSYGHWILLQRNNLPVPNRLPELLGRMPTPIASAHISLPANTPNSS